MNIEWIPTVRSLLDQKAISFSGDEALILNLSAVLFFKERIIKPNFTYDGSCETYHMRIDEAPRLIDSLNRPITKQVLYSIELLPERFTLTAHIHNATGCDNKTIYTKLNPNLNHLGHTFNALYRRLDESQQFVICQHCKQLVAAKLCLNAICGCTCNDISAEVGCNAQDAHQQCENTFKQTFDTHLVDRISSLGKAVSVFKDEDLIKFYISSIAWPHPHESYLYDRVIDTLPLTATLDEVNTLKLKLEGEQKYPAPCYYCKSKCIEGDAMNLSSLVDFATDAIICDGCASEHFHVVY
ncbi:hypothetical protein [Shewanella sp.]|uniref:hypothetical protein n=1 Tax=Shewanella sp. TaxID=50422 RepID=UPI0040540192